MKTDIPENRNLEVQDWGVEDYQAAFLRQQVLVRDRISGSIGDRLVMVEHPPVVSIGRSGSLQDLRMPEAALHEKGIALCPADRGGMATFHGPGQMVAYPIVKLATRDLHRYLQQLLQVVATVLEGYDLQPQFKENHPGVWVDGAKVASVGIAVKKWVAYHGVALNVNTDPRWFSWIVPCGNARETITSMAQVLGAPLDLDEVKARFIETFARSFGYTLPDEPRIFSKHPPWLIRKAPSPDVIAEMERRLRRLQVETVCQCAHCPNIGECFASGTATFMLLGTRCTRRCRFCAVDKGSPQPVDPAEPERVARAASALGLNYVVVTSVTRDDLPDGGAGHFVRTIGHIRRYCPGAGVEVLVPDFNGDIEGLQQVCSARPDMFNHNIETVERLYPRVRPIAAYRRSLGVLEVAAGQGLRVKSGLMMGLGETKRETMEALRDLSRAGCRYLTLGQYLAPSTRHFPVARFVPPGEFEQWAETARSMGFKGVAAGPLVRSSYHAAEMVENDGAMGAIQAQNRSSG